MSEEKTQEIRMSIRAHFSQETHFICGECKRRLTVENPDVKQLRVLVCETVWCGNRGIQVKEPEVVLERIV